MIWLTSIFVREVIAFENQCKEKWKKKELTHRINGKNEKISQRENTRMHVRMHDGAGATEQRNQDIMKQCWATNFKVCPPPAIESGTFSKGKYGLQTIRGDLKKVENPNTLKIPGDDATAGSNMWFPTETPGLETGF